MALAPAETVAPSTSSERNMGLWLACPSWSLGSRAQNFVLTGGDQNTWVNTSSNFANYADSDIVFATTGNDLDGGVTVEIAATDTLCCSLLASSSGDANTRQLLVQGAINYAAQTDTTPSGRYVHGSPADSNKMATWYIPNDGMKGYTYQSFTGRYAGQVIPSIRWHCSAVIGNRVFYGNVDTEDENQQTVRERSRVYYTPIYKPDEIDPRHFKDFGKNDGDEIIGLQSLDGRLYILKERNIYIYNVSAGNEMNWYTERHHRGVGCSHKHLAVPTRYGVVCADERQVSLVTPQEVIELTLPIRASWQALTLDGPSMAYAPKKNELIVLPDADSNDVNFWIYNFDYRSWSQMTLDKNIQKTNLVMGSDMNGLYAENTGKRVKKMNDSGADNTETATIKTKQFDFGAPDIKKRFGRIYITYKTDDEAADALTVTCYLDGSGSAAKTFSSEFPAKAALTNVGNFINLVGKTLELKFACAGQDFVLDDVIVEYTMMGHTP